MGVGEKEPVGGASYDIRTSQYWGSGGGGRGRRRVRGGGNKKQMEKGEDETKKKKRGSIGMTQVGIPGMARRVVDESKASIAQLAGSGRTGKETAL